MEIPANLRAMAEQAGIDIDSLVSQVAPGQTAEHVTPPAASAQTEARVVPTETVQQKLERELAVSREETNQVRKLAQTATEGRVAGSGGTLPGQPAPLPNLGSIEPGIRWMYAQGLITDEQLESKVGPALAEMLKNHVGGTI